MCKSVLLLAWLLKPLGAKAAAPAEKNAVEIKIRESNIVIKKDQMKWMIIALGFTDIFFENGMQWHNDDE